jgi:hypothetical protein
MIKTFLKIAAFASFAKYAMTLALNEAIPFYRPGKDITAKATVALTGKRLCAIVGNRTSGPGLASTDDPGVYQVGAPAAGGRVFGVVGYDVPSGSVVPIKRNGIIPVTTSGAFTAEQEAKVAADGTILPVTAGAIAVGIVHTACSSGADAEFELYSGQSAR